MYITLNLESVKLLILVLYGSIVIVTLTIGTSFILGNINVLSIWKRFQERLQQQHGWCLSIGGYCPGMFLVLGLN